MKTTVRLQRQAAGRGFTLIELLLTLVILLLLLGAAVVNFSSLQSGVQLEEGAAQLESAMRYARAHAANTGCKVRLAFEEFVDDELAVPLGNVFAEWEPDPLNRPGQWVPLREVDLLIENLLQAVEISDVVSLDGGPAPVADEFDEFEDEAANFSFPPIVFYPDGSSDSAEVIVSSRNREEDSRQISITIIGATGVIRTRLLTPEPDLTLEAEVAASK